MASDDSRNNWKIWEVDDKVYITVSKDIEENLLKNENFDVKLYHHITGTDLIEVQCVEDVEKFCGNTNNCFEVSTFYILQYS